MIKKTLVVVALLSLASSPAMAGLITLASGSLVANAANPIPVGTTYTPGSTAGGGVDGGAIGFVAPSAGTLKITVVDCCFIGDVYEVVLNGTSLGWTSPVALGGSLVSSGVFTAAVLGGAGSIDFWDITLSYLNEASPFGGGVVPESYSPAGFSYTVQFEAVPEPTTVLLLGAGLAGLGLRRRNRA